MNWYRRLIHRNKMEDQLEKELQFHIDQHAADLIASGQPRDEARRLARLAIGGPEQTKENCRDARGTRWLEDLYQDCRHSLRALRRQPGFTATALLTIAFGTGAMATVITLANTLFLRDLPVDRPDRVVVVQATRRHGQSPGWVSYPDYVHFRDKTKTLQGLAAHYSTAPLFVTVNNQAKELNGASYLRTSSPYSECIRHSAASSVRMRTACRIAIAWPSSATTFGATGLARRLMRWARHSRSTASRLP